MLRVFGAAILAGLIAGLFVSLVQDLRIVPLIAAAESYETAAHAGHAHHGDLMAADAAWTPADGLERRAFTWLANVLTGIGFALLLAGAFALRGRAVDARTGLVWGLGGFAAFALAPALGLPPELPGMAGDNLADRQLWWVLTAATTAGGLVSLAFGRGLLWIALGAALIALPHLAGAPHGHGEAALPAGLVAEFVAASLVVGAAFWAVLGALTGFFYRRLG